MALLSGYSGEHPIRKIAAAAVAPYPCAGDIRVNGVWISEIPSQVRPLDQSYNFGNGELTTRFEATVGEITATVEVLTFCDRAEPTLVCQRVEVEVSGACDLTLEVGIDANAIDGRALRQTRETPDEPEPACDGALRWESAGGHSTCGVAYVTDMTCAGEPERPPLTALRMTSAYTLRAQAGRKYRLSQISSLIPDQMHRQPDQQAVRLVALAKRRGFEAIRAANRACWAELWKGRIVIESDDPRWQALSDAALFYILSSTHPSSQASTSIFGLATWHDYHYYHGHVMWDIETFVAPVLSLLQPGAARAILDYRTRSLESARSNARLRGREGLQFPWESDPSEGQECAPMPGSASWHEDHVSLDVARAFVFHAQATGDTLFLRRAAWPVVLGVAEWIRSRVTTTARGYEIRAAMGIAERKIESDNAAFTNMSAVMVLRDATRIAGELGLEARPEWAEIADGMVLPLRGKVLVSHDGYRSNEEKGATPDPLMGVFPLDFPLEPDVRSRTLDYYLAMAGDYIGSPMLSALYGVWAARAGDRATSARLLDEGYGQFQMGRFSQILEYRPDAFPEQPRAGPFFANMGGFVIGLLLGFTCLRPGAGSAAEWPVEPVVLPRGWTSISVDRLWVHGRPHRLVARHGEERALLEAL
jgi:trehalose/maltose hydrolase-like predicted phosphorylase